MTTSFALTKILGGNVVILFAWFLWFSVHLIKAVGIDFPATLLNFLSR